MINDLILILNVITSLDFKHYLIESTRVLDEQEIIIRSLQFEFCWTQNLVERVVIVLIIEKSCSSGSQ